MSMLAVAPPQAPGTTRAELDAFVERADAQALPLWLCHLPHAGFLDPMGLLGYLAAQTRTSLLGVAVLLPLHHRPAMLASQLQTIGDLSEGRLEVGVGAGARPPPDDDGRGRGERFEHAIEIMRATWTAPLRLWIGANAPTAIARAARIADGWIGSGSSSPENFRANVALLRSELERAGRDPSTYGIAKRVFLHHDTDPKRARAELGRWFADVYGAPRLTADGGVAGTENACLDHLGAILDAGADFVLVHAPIAPLDHLDWVIERALPTFTSSSR
jgi:alkanesulfonate monooxygenase SsuD/methylene tetrahydromethanopterin reductase-like flavin-dependent oxidoreductase (luciferase family)